ncbi:MAG TPA: tyrosine-type recombinase/integrase [Chitinophagaceae bacterium]|nr:tyrosine-type recombinase/integrase [Chitinophagaceae bacterium]
MDITLLSQQFCSYSLSFKGYSNNTIRRYRTTISSFSRFTRITTLDQVTDEKIRALFYTGRTERRWSVNTYIGYRKTLLVFFRWCVKNGYMEKNPVVDIEIPKMEKKLPVKLTKQDSLKLLELVYNYPYEYKFLRYRNHAIFSTFIFAGLRRQELLNLQFTDVDTENLTILIRMGKGGKDRLVPMCHTLAHTLKRYKEERKRLNKTNPAFFCSLRGNKPFTGNGLKKLVEKLRKSFKIPFSIHKLRHTFATLMLEGGCDIYSLSKMMGHSDINTTTIYLSASAEHLRSQIMKHPMNEIVI